MIDSRSEQGSALLEFSLLTPIVIFIFLGMIDFSIGIDRAMLVTQTASIIAQYGTIYPSTATSPNATNTSVMSAAASYAAQGLSGMTVTPTTFYACTPGGAHVASSSTCATYATPLLYVQVNTSVTVPVLVNYPGLPGSFALQGLSVLRVP